MNYLVELKIFIRIARPKQTIQPNQTATIPCLIVTAASKVVLVKEDYSCWEVIYLLKVTVTASWITFMGPICTLLTFLTACLCLVREARRA